MKTKIQHCVSLNETLLDVQAEWPNEAFLPQQTPVAPAVNEPFFYQLPPFSLEMLHELREQKKYTYSQIAYRSGLPKTTVHKLAHGESAQLSHKNFRKLLRLYCGVCYDAEGVKKVFK
jgi:hypothetical protein